MVVLWLRTVRFCMTKSGSKYRVLTAVLIIILTTFTLSKTAQADLVSLFSKMLGNQEASAKLSRPRTADSQTSATVVLQAAANTAPVFLAATEPPIDDDNALSPDIARANATSTEDINTQISTYVVRPGDNLTGVAKMFGVSINTIMWANDFTGRSVLQPGQTLVILPVTGISHTVKKGDSIQSIAKQYKADVEDILNYNDLTLGSTLAIGVDIIIPNAETPNQAAATARAVPVSSYPGYYSCPLPGGRISQKLHGHNGVDLAAPVGTAIRAAAGGTVIIDRSNGAWNGGYGNFVVILHPNGTQTLYSHMSRSTVDSGQTVSKGQVVGYVGMTGLTTGPHLHFEVRGATNPFTSQANCR